MDGEHAKDDGYLVWTATIALRALGTHESEGWAPIRKFWAELAADRICNEDAAKWAREIAKRIVGTVFDESPGERPRAALKAIGLVGVEQPDWDERRALETFIDFAELAAPDRKYGGTSATQRLRFMRDCGFYNDCADSTAKKRIERLAEKIRPKSNDDSG